MNKITVGIAVAVAIMSGVAAGAMPDRGAREPSKASRMDGCPYYPSVVVCRSADSREP
jgi:hypothetical protein